MTLLEILVRDLPKLGGWPDGVRTLEQYGSGFVYDSRTSYTSELPFEMADFWPTSLVTREQYKAALAAVEPEWNGEGLPPVGCECEAKYGSPTAEWFHFKCLHVDCGVSFGWAGKEPVVLRGSVYEFRPIRSEAYRKLDEASSAMHKEWRAVAGKADANGQLIDIYSAIYQAIEAGQIPHLKIV